MNGDLFDANVLLDIINLDPRWLVWSEAAFEQAIASGPILINPIIYAELAPAFASQADLDRWLHPSEFERRPLPFAAGWLAAQAFLKYRKAGGAKTAPLPDFFIGAHAVVDDLTLVTRDPNRYRTYFPSISLQTP